MKRPLNRVGHPTYKQAGRAGRHTDTLSNAAARDKRANLIQHRMPTSRGRRPDLHPPIIARPEAALGKGVGAQVRPVASDMKPPAQHNHAIGIRAVRWFRLDGIELHAAALYVKPPKHVLLEQRQRRLSISVPSTVNEQHSQRL